MTHHLGLNRALQRSRQAMGLDLQATASELTVKKFCIIFPARKGQPSDIEEGTCRKNKGRGNCKLQGNGQPPHRKILKKHGPQQKDGREGSEEPAGKLIGEDNKKKIDEQQISKLRFLGLLVRDGATGEEGKEDER